MATLILPEPKSGSRWRRWDPHVHAPGTVHNDQFTGPDAWDRYLAALESRTPVIEAIGVTDYYVLDTYERMLEAKAAGRLPNCQLLFPNIEMRLSVGTIKGSQVNMHMLVNPADEDHVDQTKRFLTRLTFEAHGDIYSCTNADLMKLGIRKGAPKDNAAAALALGASQFKVSLEQLKAVYRSHEWAQRNVLFAVAGGIDDGTSGVRDRNDATLRQEIEKVAHVIFASSVAQREYWLGLRAASREELEELCGGLKPCLHGSDGHSVSTAGEPAENRRTWIKGDPIFDSLCQACIDPEGRAYVGAEPPSTADSSQVIAKVSLNGTPWCSTPELHINPGLVAIIGTRGSGKTALADMIAAGCDAMPESANHQSFLYRAREFLDGAEVALTWGSGEIETTRLDVSLSGIVESFPRARYLSQQFVEKLCAADGMTEALLKEIERIVYDAHDVNSRDGTVDFDDLLELRASRPRKARAREEAALQTLSDRIGTELDKMRQVTALKVQVREKKAEIKRYLADRAKLVAKGSEKRLERLQELTAAAEEVRSNVRYFKLQEQDLLGLKDEVDDLRKNQAPERLRDTRERHSPSGIKQEDWDAFLTDYKGPVDDLLAAGLRFAKKAAQDWQGVAPTLNASDDVSYLAEDADLADTELNLLEAEIARLNRLVTVDKQTAQRFGALSKKVTEENANLARLEEKLADAEAAKARVEKLRAEREESYGRALEAAIAEQHVLSELYAPIRERLTGKTGTLQKLSFAVTRVANVAEWAEQGEELLDLRFQGPFKGIGQLQKVAEKQLRLVWEAGTAEEIAVAMKSFREEHQEALLSHTPVAKSSAAEYRSWLKKFAQWLYNTSHIAVHYSVDYDGVAIQNLSPGTRGIVLLLLYLSLDEGDERPLIIDQPEENLDPRSIYTELVQLFLDAKSKRQVIMVTHNANLVVNTDADQIIIASAAPHEGDGPPTISYLAGGLENAEIRKMVCDILEGGERAFKERARRLRVRLER